MAPIRMYDWITEESESDTCTSYPARKVWEGSTAACPSVLIADSDVFGRMLFLDGELQSASADEHVYHEALVHPAMSCVGDGSRVLVIGGGEGATVREVLKWAPELVSWVDIDGDLVNLCEEHLGWARGIMESGVVTFYPDDIRNILPYLPSYDVIIMDLPDPDGDTGYLYSDDFMTDVRAHLSPSGVIVTHCGPVRPFGSIGAGFQRLVPHFGTRGFYTQMIPSFQSEWGFLLWNKYGFRNIGLYTVPNGLRVANQHQIALWRSRNKLWNDAIQLVK